MYKRFLRCISMLLVLVMLAEMLPVTGIRSLVPKVYATDGSPESSNAVSAPVESQNTVFADIPATIIDETSQSPLTSPKLTENNQRYIDILSSYALFSQLSQVDAAFFIDFTGVTAALYTELEERGLGLAESVNYAHLISDFECSVSQALALNINCAYRLYAVERKIDTKVRNIGQQKCYNDLRKRRRSLAWHEQRASRLKNFALVSARKRAAGRNYSGFGFQTALSARNAAVRNITQFAGGTRSSAVPADTRLPSPQKPLCTARICP